MKFVWRTILLLAVFAGVWMLTARAVVHHVANAGASESQIKLAGAMAGLSVGAAVTLVLGLWMVLRKKSKSNSE